MAIPTAIRRPPRSPRTLRITADAGVVVAASPSVPSTRTQITFTATYTITTAVTREFISRTRYRVVTNAEQADATLTGAVVNLLSYPSATSAQVECLIDNSSYGPLPFTGSVLQPHFATLSAGGHSFRIRQMSGSFFFLSLTVYRF